MGKTNVLLAEDHAMVRKGILALLKEEGGIEIDGESEDGREVLDLVDEYESDLVIMDITMPGLNGLEATKRINNRHPETDVVILTRHTNEEYIFKALEAGASGYIVKQDLPDELTSAIRTVVQGDKYFSPSITTRIVDRLMEKTDQEDEIGDRDPLTSREREVIQLIAEGHTNSQIAEVLHLSEKTIETHRNNLMQKLDLHNVADLTKYAVERGIIETES